MGLELHALSGSPFSWKVWLSLEHKQAPYTLVLRSADQGELRTPEFLALNPRGKVPVIADGGFVLYESSAIVEYLHEAFDGEPLWPRDVRERAIARRLAAEAADHLYPPTRRLVTELSGRSRSDEAVIEEAKRALSKELDLVSSRIRLPFVMGTSATAVDYATYPLVAIVVHRLARRAPERGFEEIVPSKVRRWMEHVEALPFYARTYPPHWRTS